ncbi:MAG: mechanosensitive ion channel domain-containing protein [Rhodospirillales bacterium]
MIRSLLLLSMLLVLAPRLVGAADAPPTIAAAQAKAALDVLTDPKKRAALEATLRAIAIAAPTGAAVPAANAATPVTPPEAAATLEPDSMGAQILLRANATVAQFGDRIRTTLKSARSAPLLWSWMVVMATNPLGQAILWDVGWRVALSVIVGLGAYWLLRRALRRLAGRLDAAASDLAPTPADVEERAEHGDLEALSESAGRLAALLQKSWLALGRFGIALLPLFALLAAGHAVAVSVGERQSSGLATEAVLGATALCMALAKAMRVVLSPTDRRLRLVPIGDAAAVYAMRWSRRLIAIAVGGYTIAEVGVLLGLSELGHDAALRVTGLLLTICTGTIVVSQRRAVRAALRAPAAATGAASAVRNGLAKIWHWLALGVLAGIWLAWAVDGSGYNGDVVRTVAMAAAVLAGTKLILLGAIGQIDRLPAIGAGAADRYPGLEDRLRLYHPMLRAAVRAVIYMLAVAALLQVLGSGALVWLWATPGGQRVLSGVLTMAFTLLAAVALWELANAAIQRHLDSLLQGAQVARSARLRTLLPLLRTALLIAIGVVSVLMILSEIGVNIAPLLAGAGILGVAIGFGSQKLVQDLITGIFLLLENALQVGDWVNVAGLAGRVEGLSVRTIRLRAADGTVHIVPFSSVASVTNHTRGIGNADVRATVEFDVDTDKVAEIMQSIVADMRAESEFEAKIVQDFQLFGVDRIDAAGVTVTGQVACTDSGRWSVQREINRRIKLRFQEAGIRFFSQPLPMSD